MYEYTTTSFQRTNNEQDPRYEGGYELDHDVSVDIDHETNTFDVVIDYLPTSDQSKIEADLNDYFFIQSKHYGLLDINQEFNLIQTKTGFMAYWHNDRNKHSVKGIHIPYSKIEAIINDRVKEYIHDE